MGAGDSKLSFKKSVFRLAEEKNIPANDPYWLSFWELPETAEDVFTLFSATDIRRTRDTHLENLETLILAVTSRLLSLRRDDVFPDPELAPERDALNCIRILTRLLPFLFESEPLEEWQTKFFWGLRRKRVRGATESDVIFDDTDQPPEEQAEYEDAQPLMEELIDVLIDLLFYQGFTLPPNSGAAGESKVSYAIWQSGVGCNVPVGTTKEGESNKIEILRLLLAITSKAMFMPASVLPVKGEKALTYMTTCPDKRAVLSVLCSLLNTTVKYNPASWRVPYDHVVFTDPRQVLVTYSLQMLLVLLLYPVPAAAGPGLKNNYRQYLGRLHRTQDFQFCVDGMTRILNQPIQATTSYLPGSQKILKWAPEMLMLFWETLQCNKRFRSFIIETDRVHDFVVLIVYYALEYRLDPSKSGVVRMCVFVLQTLSTESKFGKCLNKRFEGQASLPASVRIPSFSGTYADYLIISIFTLITTSKGKLGAVYPALLAIIANVAPHVQHLSSISSNKIVQLFASISSPSFLLANEDNHKLLHSLLESINAIIEHQYTQNPNFIYALLRSHKRIEALRTFTLESGQSDLDSAARRRKDRGPHDLDLSTPTETPKQSLSLSRNPSAPTSPSAFEIADSDDEEDSDDSASHMRPTNRQTSRPSSRPASQPSSRPASPPTIASPNPTDTDFDSSTLPLQLRGMSEKARGKLPEHTFMRTNSISSISSLHSHPPTPTTSSAPGYPFTPTPSWLDTWLPHLPLHTLLTTTDQLLPLLQKQQSTQTIHSLLAASPPTGIEPQPVKTHMFEWSPLALGWYESLLWGFVYVSERDVGKGQGTIGVWNGARVRLFRVQETKAEGPSLLQPRGGVDAVGRGLAGGVREVVGRFGGAAGRESSDAQRDPGTGRGAGEGGGRSAEI